MEKDLPILLFETIQQWNDWLEENHSKSPGIWLRIAKKGKGLTSVSYEEALEVALCFGWIDGRKNKYDDSSWIQHFTARKGKSIWSKINKEKALKLIDNGDMQPAGFAAIETAKLNGMWDKAYDSQSKIVVPEDFQLELNKNEVALLFFQELDSVNRYAILHRLQKASSAELRKKKMNEFLQMLQRREKIYS